MSDNQTTAWPPTGDEAEAFGRADFKAGFPMQAPDYGREDRRARWRLGWKKEQAAAGTRPLTDEQWLHWQKLVSDEHDRQSAEIERLHAKEVQLRHAIRTALALLRNPYDGGEYEDGEFPAVDALRKAINDVEA